MNVHIGLDIIGNFGATVPEMHGQISKMEDTAQGTMVDVMWDNGSVHHITLDDIRDDYGIAESEQRHPNISSGIPWPLVIRNDKNHNNSGIRA